MRLRVKMRSNRKKGILLPLSSLPSKHGIGSLGIEAYNFVDFLSETGQSYWQILPICPVGRGNSPYASFSGFAGEILYIDLDLLVSDGLLTQEEIGAGEFTKNVDYKAVRKFKTPLLKTAVERFNTENNDFKLFKEQNSYWLYDFALFMAIRNANLNADFLSWDDGLKYRLPHAIKEFEAAHQSEINFYTVTQYFFFKQYNRLHNYANTCGIKIIGDIPFYVDLESADIWGRSENFKLGRDMTPTLVAGVPPDIFSTDGQLWGNPIYNWDYLKANDYLWWKQRLIHNAKLFDALRIDHFRAFADYYTISAGSQTAKHGKWETGAGIAFWDKMKPFLNNTLIIAEDLGGEESPLVKKLLAQTGFPNMKILQFAFDSNLSDPYLPKNYDSNCVCYTGTHDNDTTLGWYEKLSQKEKFMFDKLVPKKYNSPVLNLISFGLKSKADIVIIPLQDYLQLDSSHRLNIPGVATGNWEWRFGKEDITDTIKKTISTM